MRIVEIEYVGANAIQQRGMEHVRPLGAERVAGGKDGE